MHLNTSSYRTPVLNADGRPLSTYPLSIVSAQDAVSAIWQTITSIVHTLLDGADARRWWSVHRQLDLFAEAAPDVFLSAVESSLERNDPPIMALFMADKTPVMGGTYYGDLLGGLERLAWSPKYLPRVALLLARLAVLARIERQNVNRPSNSLCNIFLLWAAADLRDAHRAPQCAQISRTTTGAEAYVRRNKAADRLVRRAPD
jgi:hypothetical protein